MRGAVVRNRRCVSSSAKNGWLARSITARKPVCSVSSFESQSSLTPSILDVLSDASNLVSDASSFSRCPSFTVDSSLKFSSP